MGTKSRLRSVSKILIITSVASSTRLEDSIGVLARRFDVEIVSNNRGERYLTLSVLHRLMLSRPDVLLFWNAMPKAILAITMVAKMYGAKVAVVVSSSGSTSKSRDRLRVHRASVLYRLKHPNLALADLVVTGLLEAAVSKHSVRTHVSQHGNSERLIELLLALVGDDRSADQLLVQFPIKLDLGCGSLQRPGFIGVDVRQTRATSLVADAQALPLATGTVDLVYATCLLEHFDSPTKVLHEVNRVLRSTGEAVFRLPNLGTYSSHLDTTHRFLADLALWRTLFSGYFEVVEVRPVGTKYRDSLSLMAVNWVLVNGFHWYELAQGWDFVCRQPRPEPILSYIGWWEEGEHEGRIGGEVIKVE